MSGRFLVMGDNHGDTESLRRVLHDTAGDAFDYVVHVGNFTRAMCHDDPDLGAEQLREVEPALGEFEDRYAPLDSTDDGRLVVAERSCAY